MTPVIFGIAGPRLSADERALFAACNPAGYILFARNCIDPAQVRALTDDLKSLSGRADLPILIDQEGGRVVRLGPPHWPTLPAAEAFDRLYDRAPATAIAAVRANAQAIGHTLALLGITVNCAPMLEVRQAGASAIIGDRAFGADPLCVAALGRAMLEGMASAGVVGVIKHLPGYGRAVQDAHNALPRIDADAAALENDLAPFRALAPHARMGMTAHAIFSAWDDGDCATLSARVIEQIIRGRIGFDGLLMTDGIEMGALDGPMEQRAARALAAGCDVVLHCTGQRDEMEAMASRLSGTMTAAARARLDRAMASSASAPDATMLADALARRDALLTAG